MRCGQTGPPGCLSSAREYATLMSGSLDDGVCPASQVVLEYTWRPGLPSRVSLGSVGTSRGLSALEGQDVFSCVAYMSLLSLTRWGCEKILPTVIAPTGYRLPVGKVATASAVP